MAIANRSLDAALAEARDALARRNPESVAQHQAATAVMPGGNTRTVLFAKPFPLALARGEGAWVWDIDGHRYADFLGEYTAGLFGHSHPVIRRAIDQALDAGINLGGQGRREAELAAAVCRRFGLERVRFTNSGTEANLMAISTAVAVTGRPRVMVFEGGYHGGVFYFRAGGSPINAPFDFVTARYNDTDAATALIAEHGPLLAAVILEPMLGGGGCIPATSAFLHAIRDATRAAGALMILDEVMTSRLAPGGLQSVHGIAPDLTTLGKYVGGGMSFGAFGGRADLMDRFDPRRPGAFPHAGTFNNNPLTMAAGLAGLTQVYTPEAAAALNARGDALRGRLNAAFARAEAPMQATGLGSMMTVHFTAAPIARAADAPDRSDLKELFHLDMLAAGIWMAPRGMINLSLPIGDEHCDQLVRAVEEFVGVRGGLLSS